MYGRLRNRFLHTYLHRTQGVYERTIDQTLVGLYKDSSYQAYRYYGPLLFQKKEPFNPISSPYLLIPLSSSVPRKGVIQSCKCGELLNIAIGFLPPFLIPANPT